MGAVIGPRRERSATPIHSQNCPGSATLCVRSNTVSMDFFEKKEFIDHEQQHKDPNYHRQVIHSFLSGRCGPLQTGASDACEQARKESMSFGVISLSVASASMSSNLLIDEIFLRAAWKATQNGGDTL